MNKVQQMLETLEKELRNEKQYSSADKLLPIIEEAKKEKFTDYHGVIEQLKEYINESNNIDYNRALVEAIEVIEKRTYLKDGWIPCNKELPKKSGRYLAIVTFGKSKFQIIEILIFKKGRNRWFRQGRGNEVIAWRELPEPYKGE